jgi:hypothetical protein
MLTHLIMYPGKCKNFSGSFFKTPMAYFFRETILKINNYERNIHVIPFCLSAESNENNADAYLRSVVCFSRRVFIYDCPMAFLILPGADDAF